ncbi:unnamed protein product [Urochloa decumbens]|uniref:F-box domain-containing protein n=1 Tax=Urochloa decumbens TaxID=240449 RepID=A0ABC9GBR7_9POAL
MADEAVLPGDLIEQILLRLPPSDPASLVCAALVCMAWRRLVSDAGFGLRFREAHRQQRAPPMLSFLCNITDYDVDDDDAYFTARFVPTSSCPHRDRFVPTCPLTDCSSGSGWHALDSRHGRVLLHTLPYGAMHNRMVVWDPIADEQVELPKMPQDPYPYHWGWNAALLCATCGGDDLGCHHTPFIVVFVGSMPTMMFARVYLSEAAAWSEITTGWLFAHDCLMRMPSALAGNMLYFQSSGSMILKYDVTTRKISKIHLPDTVDDPENVALTVSEGGGLGFTEAVGSRLYLWSRNAGPDKDAGWTQSRVIELDRLFSIEALSTTPEVLGFAADGVGVIFLQTNDGIFTVDPKSE